MNISWQHYNVTRKILFVLSFNDGAETTELAVLKKMNEVYSGHSGELIKQASIRFNDKFTDLTVGYSIWALGHDDYPSELEVFPHDVQIGEDVNPIVEADAVSPTPQNMKKTTNPWV